MLQIFTCLISLFFGVSYELPFFNIEMISSESINFSQSKGTLNELQGEDIILYPIYNGKLRNSTPLTKDTKWKQLIKDKQQHQEIWNLILEIIPEEQTKYIEELVLSSGSQKNYSVFVQPIENSNRWIMNVNVNAVKNSLGFISHLIRSSIYMKTLNIHQIKHANDNNSCKEYYHDYGCSIRESYINQFYKRFWKVLMPEWSKEQNNELFYTRHVDQFVTSQAAMDLTEDLAESFYCFIFNKYRDSETMIEKKVAFFSEFPELIQFRSTMLSRINKYLSKQL